MSTTDFTKPEYRFNSNTFGIKSNDDIVPITQDCGLFPGVHDDYLVYNVGRTEVYCEVQYGTKVLCYGNSDTATVQPGEIKVLSNRGRNYYVTALKIYNNTGERAVVHCANARQILHFGGKGTRCAVGIKYVSYIGSGLPGLIKTFWPDNQPSIWDRISDKVEALVDKRILERIEHILSRDVTCYRDRIAELSRQIEESRPREYLRANYVNIAQHVIDFENVFVFDKQVPDYRTVNQYILPYYSLTVLMKVSFYVIGIRYRQRIGLTNGDIEKILYCARSTIYGCKANLGANKYIENMYLEVSSERKALKYICIWNHLVENLTYKGIYNDVVTYSTFFGRQTPKQIAWAIPEERNEPLSPSLVSFKIGSSYILGTVCKDVVTVEFNDALLIKMEVFGTGAVDRLRLHFSDGRDINVGENCSNHNAVFELENHHIVGMFVASDNWSLRASRQL
ncbi:hypothetical protein NQ317_015926 [Molorchus minor]|uniref:Uncharacterized protein n=1 Tax=Molorchus minor TaxID=1323400 RepID=A0ABQ9JJP4_9CUCU|nr:hypothetical protein NQ317_015926 [Molorchus minor]